MRGITIFNPEHISEASESMRMAQQTFASSDLGLSLDHKNAQESVYLVHPIYANLS